MELIFEIYEFNDDLPAFKGQPCPGQSRDGPGPRAGTVLGSHRRRLQKPFMGYALSNAVRWTVKGMNFEINVAETLEFVF